eukprot:CAMPEP_0197526990 /NCGR_PEP_ID=MMETSP1318-20131121/19962_1 /TAXON_ID=552666 /ORGANISM="Partenskyella glossopodia, Strain RCC365" /LENGTH=191 /DNA_ID=CAMNT_0043081417 /DNA_START=39 /DNA_END=611 /DNA_ORIENTATION=+
MTSKWYRAVFERLQSGDRILDIGIGTAAALVRNPDVVRAKDLKICGIDYEKAYIDRAKTLIKSSGLEDNVSVFCRSIYEPGLRSVVLKENENQPYDAAYFSGSFTLMPEPHEALKVAAKMCKPGAPIYITQTYQLKYSPITAVVKPLLKYLTTVDFGHLTYMTELDKIVSKAGMTIEENIQIPGSINTSYQ